MRNNKHFPSDRNRKFQRGSLKLRSGNVSEGLIFLGSADQIHAPSRASSRALGTGPAAESWAVFPTSAIVISLSAGPNAPAFQCSSLPSIAAIEGLFDLSRPF
jgi:hypothetical protein